MVEVNSANDVAVRGNPSLFELTVTYFPSSSVGKQCKFRLQVFNSEDSAYSDYAQFTLAGVPQAPSVAPLDDSAVTTDNKIGLNLTPLSSAVETGGSPVISYEIMQEVDGVFIPILSTTS